MFVIHIHTQAQALGLNGFLGLSSTAGMGYIATATYKHLTVHQTDHGTPSNAPGKHDLIMHGHAIHFPFHL